MDSLAPTRPVALDRPTPTARRLAEASLSLNTRRAYSGALRRLDAWLDGRGLDDQALAAYLAELHDQGRAPSSASTAVAAACFRARLAGEPVRTVAVARTPKDRRLRPKRWTDAVDQLRTLQAEYQAWRDGLPESLADSRTAELLEGVCDVDLDALDVELPRGFGRD